jgi:hypothetical protein
MTQNTGQSFNSNDIAITPDPILIGSITAVTVKPATDLEQPHQEFMVHNAGNQTLWLRKYAAIVDNTKKGEPILPGEKKTFSLPNMVTSEWSAIFSTGGGRDVYTQYS